MKKQEIAKASVYSIQRVKEKSVTYDLGMQIIQPHHAARFAFESLNLGALTAEVFVVVSLDTKNQIVGVNIPFRGTLNTSIVHPRDVYQAALLNNANSIIVMHNHPSGDPTPSNEDIDITKRLIEAGNILGIPLLDHIIVGNSDSKVAYISLKERGAF